MPAKTNKLFKYVFIVKTVIDARAKNCACNGLFKQTSNRQGAAGMALYLFCDWESKPQRLLLNIGARLRTLE
jgi:hypothetical protein